jgi:type IV pilus assembly protein PilC
MEFTYIAYDKNRKLIRGKIAATNDTAAANMLGAGGYQILSLKQGGLAFLNSEKLNVSLGKVNPKEIIMFSRQMALLLSSGTDIVVALELLQSQVTDKEMKKRLGEVAADLRGGMSLSGAMHKHPRVFPSIYYRAIAAGEKSGNLGLVMRQMADYMEKRMITEKKIRGALSYPIFVVIVAVVVVAVLVNFVLPSFSSLYSAFGTNLPTMARIMMSSSHWLRAYGLYLLLGFVAVGAGIFSLSKTPSGKKQIDTALLRMPVIGRITNLNELSRLCRTMSLLFRVGLPLPEILALSAQNTNNVIVSESLNKVQQGLIHGEGLSKPMRKRSFFLPLMVQMVAVGEETGNLDTTLTTVAETYEVEADDRTSAAIGLIQPVLTIFIGGLIALIAVTMVSAMYSLYSTVS